MEEHFFEYAIRAEKNKLYYSASQPIFGDVEFSGFRNAKRFESQKHATDVLIKMTSNWNWKGGTLKVVEVKVSANKILS